MYLFVLIFEIIGTVSFAISGAMTGWEKRMDIFGVCMLGVTTAVGGGVIRDLLLGITPPTAFVDPRDVLIAIVVSMIVFIPIVRRVISVRQIHDTVMLIADSAGLGIFTVYGMKVAIDAGFGDNFFLVLIVAVPTGVGGGVMRDLFAGNRPYIFVKHIYACASLVGAVVSKLMWTDKTQNLSMIAGFAVIVVIRICSAYFHWSLPKAKGIEGE